MNRWVTARQWILAITLSLGVSGTVVSTAQEIESLPDAPSAQYQVQRYANEAGSAQGLRSSITTSISPHSSTTDKLRDLPRRFMLGSGVPPDRELYSLNNQERLHLYLHTTYFSVGAFADRVLGAGYDQARGVPSEWGGGMEGFGKRFASRYTQFVIRNSLKSAGDAALGYEPRYDLCRCDGFWPRTKHAIIRNFMTYDSTERQLRPHLPLYGAAFAAGMVATTWRPGPHNVLVDGAVAAAEQAGWGALTNWLSEFSGDIGRKLSKRH